MRKVDLSLETVSDAVGNIQEYSLAHYAVYWIYVSTTPENSSKKFSAIIRRFFRFRGIACTTGVFRRQSRLLSTTEGHVVHTAVLLASLECGLFFGTGLL